MADVAEAIAAAMRAAAAVAPPSPQVKSESPSGDFMAIDSEPLPTLPRPQSPQKRSRSPVGNRGFGQDERREEKRLKTEPTCPENDEMDEIARMVEAAQASVMMEIHPEIELHSASQPPAELKYEPEPDHDSPVELEPQPETRAEEVEKVLETTEEDQNSFEIALEAAMNHHDSPLKDVESDRDTLWSNPKDYTRRKHIIPALGALAVDILIALSEQTLEDTVATLSSDLESEIAKEYVVLRRAFDVQRRQLSSGQNPPQLLNADRLRCKGETKEIIRIANLASTCASIFGTNEMMLEDVNNHFLHIFVPEDQDLPPDAADLYLGLKTQLFLAVLEGEPEKSKTKLLEELFVTGVEKSLQAHHPNTPLTTAEANFLVSARARKTMLAVASSCADNIDNLSKQFTYEAFLDNLSTYLNDNIESIQVAVFMDTAKTIPNSPNPIDSGAQELEDPFDLDAVIAEASRAAAQTALQVTDDETTRLDDLSAFLAENVSRAVEQSRQGASYADIPTTINSAAESAQRATALALESIAKNQSQPASNGTKLGQLPRGQNGYATQHQTHSSQQLYAYQQHQAQSRLSQQVSDQPADGHLPPNQTDSTPALYERARQAAAARSSTHARREGSHSTRRPWSPEEEKALMMGLDMVKGPHWSQILSLFGPNGTISQILADRTQVQLKDKARNLKLFFLKTNSEMPYYLQCVTGELKTRAPTQAARKEAEEKARMNSEEQQAHINGILALAGGLQNNTASRPAPNATTPRSVAPHAPSLHSGPQQSAPSVTQPSSQTMAKLQPPRPAVPAPQPVRLPTFTPLSQNRGPSVPPQPTPPPRPEIVPASQPNAQPGIKQNDSTEAPPHTTSDPVTELADPNDSGLSVEDAALLGLKAAMEGESAAAAASMTPLIKSEEQHCLNNNTLQSLEGHKF